MCKKPVKLIFYSCIVVFDHPRHLCKSESPQDKRRLERRRKPIKVLSVIRSQLQNTLNMRTPAGQFRVEMELQNLSKVEKLSNKQHDKVSAWLLLSFSLKGSSYLLGACFVEICTPEGKKGRKGRKCKFQNKAHRTFDPIP